MWFYDYEAKQLNSHLLHNLYNFRKNLNQSPYLASSARFSLATFWANPISNFWNPSDTVVEIISLRSNMREPRSARTIFWLSRRKGKEWRLGLAQTQHKSELWRNVATCAKLILKLKIFQMDFRVFSFKLLDGIKSFRMLHTERIKSWGRRGRTDNCIWVGAMDWDGMDEISRSNSNLNIVYRDRVANGSGN